MKKITKKKIAKTIVKEMKKITENDKCVIAKEPVYRTPYDQETSTMMFNFIKKIIEQSGTTMDIRADRIYINCRDVKQMKVGKFSGYSDDSYLEIEIDEEGFSFTYGHTGRNYFEDKEIYTKTMKDFENIIIQKSKTSLKQAIENIYCESGLIRENNLDTLFEQ